MTFQLSVISADGGARQLEASRENTIRVKCLLYEEGEELKNARTLWDDAVVLSEIFFFEGIEQPAAERTATKAHMMSPMPILQVHDGATTGSPGEVL